MMTKLIIICLITPWSPNGKIMQKVNKMKDREFYAKLVFGARWKKVDKFLASGERMEEDHPHGGVRRAAKGQR